MLRKIVKEKFLNKKEISKTLKKFKNELKFLYKNGIDVVQALKIQDEDPTVTKNEPLFLLNRFNELEESIVILELDYVSYKKYMVYLRNHKLIAMFELCNS